jgi:thymidylate synthase (FAD)
MKITPMEVTLIDSMGSDLSVVNAARVSFHKESEWEDEVFIEEGNKDSGYGTNTNLRQMRNLLTTLQNTVIGLLLVTAFLSFRIKAPIFVARQLVKHQVGLCWNEVSRRYVSDEPEFWFPEVWRGKPVNAKQGSSGTVYDDCYGEVMDSLVADPSPTFACLVGTRHCWKMV